jgi:hypothetical protein
MVAEPSSYSPLGATVPTRQISDLGFPRAVDVLPHRFLFPTDLGYPLTASTGENLRQVWTMTGTYNITVTCPFTVVSLFTASAALSSQLPRAECWEFLG